MFGHHKSEMIFSYLYHIILYLNYIIVFECCLFNICWLMFSTSLISTTLEFILLFGLSCVFYGSLLCHCFICVFFIGVSQLSQSCLHVVLSFCLSSHVSPSLSLPPCFSLSASLALLLMCLFHLPYLFPCSRSCVSSFVSPVHHVRLLLSVFPLLYCQVYVSLSGSQSAFHFLFLFSWYLISSALCSVCFRCLVMFNFFLLCSHVFPLSLSPLCVEVVSVFLYPCAESLLTSPHVSWFPSIFPSSGYFCVLIFAYFLSLSALGSAPRLTWSATAGLDRSSLSCSKQHQAAVWKVFEQPFHRNRLSYKKNAAL